MALSKHTFDRLKTIPSNIKSYIDNKQAGDKPALLLILALVLLANLTSSCVAMNDPEESQEFRAHILGTLTPGHIFGQSFISRRPNLIYFQIWFHLDESTSPFDGNLIISLFHSPEDTNPIREFSYNFQGLIGKNQLSIPLQVRDGPAEQSYYLTLSVDKGSIQLYGRNEDAYPRGQFFIDNLPQIADIAFRSTYLYDINSVYEDLSNFIRLSPSVLLILFVVWLPGRLLISLILDGNSYDRAEIFSLSLGSSIAIIPLVILWTSQIKLFMWNTWSVVIIFIFLIALYIWLKKKSFRAFLNAPKIKFSKYWPYELGIAAIFVITLFTRLAMVRDMVTPAWVDSVHHALITNLIVDIGGFPDNYLPLLDIETANYHPGFHSIVSVFQWLTGDKIYTSLLLIGQVLNALNVLAVYLFTTTLTKNRLAGIIAGLVTGIFLPMPAYYTSWGRYTQLTGLIILPTAFVFALMLLHHYSFRKNNKNDPEKRNVRIRLLIVSSITIAGLFLTHYRVFAFLIILIVSYIVILLFKMLFDKAHNKSNFTRGMLLIGFAGIFTIVLIFPWFIETLSTLFIPRITVNPGGTPSLFNDFSWAYLTSAYGTISMIVAAIGFIVSIIQKRVYAFVLAIWVLLLFLLANANALGLPGAHFVNNTSVEIILFIPISILAGYGLAIIIDFLLARSGRRLQISLIAILIIISSYMSFLGARRILTILNPVTILTREADINALEWVKENIDNDETIVINPFAWGYGMYAGNDGGYWVAPIANMKSMPPPALYGLSSELSPVVKEISQSIIKLSDDADKLHQYLWTNGFKYIYIGARGGVISPLNLLKNPQYELLYSSDGTWLFQLLTPAQ